MRRLFIAILILAAVPALAMAQTSAPAAATGIDAFNRAFADSTRQMNTAASLALWEEDGVSLLPSTKPIIGKKAIGKFFDDVMTSLQGAKMEKFDSECFDIRVSGPWASEWCTEHQVVSIPGKPNFDGWGKMALVLHLDSDGKWRLQQEMWNQAMAPDAAAK